VVCDKLRGTLAINATLAYDGGSPTGLAVYTREVLSRLVPDLQQTDTVLLTNSTALASTTGLRCLRVPDSVVPPRQRASVLRALWMTIALPGILSRLGADLFYSTVPEGLALGAEGIRQVITIHDLLPLRYRSYLPKHYYYFRYALPAIIKHSAGIICDSEATYRDIVAMLGRPRCPVSVVPAGYAASVYHRRNDHEYEWAAVRGPYFLYVGDMRPYKNVDAALRAFASMSRHEARFVIVGNKDTKDSGPLERLVASLGIADSVEFTGYVSDTELAQLYCGATALVFPSLWEGFGLPPLEAMASGCPVITSDVASLPEVCGDAVEYVDPTSTDAIRSAMERVIHEPALREDLRGRGLERARLFSWERTAGEVWQVLESVRR
jgi:glycosyltransferase involved in cell wall biosynthesis